MVKAVSLMRVGLRPSERQAISSSRSASPGTLFAARQGFVSPESFTFAESAFVLAIVVLGGMGSQIIISTIRPPSINMLYSLKSRISSRDTTSRIAAMLGGLMVLMMIWRPQGLLPMTRVQLKLKNGQAKGERDTTSRIAARITANCEPIPPSTTIASTKADSAKVAESAFVLAIVVLGGMGSQFAVILAAILLVVSRERHWQKPLRTPDHHQHHQAAEH
jgi:ABC-type branched-subunit amino acid transport system permease subunit